MIGLHVTADTRARVLVVDDDDDLRELLRRLLERGGHEVLTAPNGREGLRRLYSDRPDLVVLDIGMADLDGWQTLDRIRDLSDVPVLLLTAMATEPEKVRGLRGGADDYVTKPFGRQELLARVGVLLRRSAARRPDAPEVLDDGVVRVDLANHLVEVEGHEVALTPLEFKLMAAFARHPQQVLTHDQLLELVWHDAINTSRDQVKLYVGYLRRKLEVVTDHPLIETVRGFGYRYHYRLPAALRRSA
ncbi:MAG TPA: response regulator transcription factor [Solirubrobacteraceae bacterium]